MFDLSCFQQFAACSVDFHVFWPFPFISELISWVRADQRLSHEVLTTDLLHRSTSGQLPARTAIELNQSYIIGFDSTSESEHWLHMSLSAFVTSQHLVVRFAGSSCADGRKTLHPSHYRLA